MIKTIKIIFSILSLLLLTALIALVIVHSLALKDNRPVKIFNYHYSIVLTGSMEPAIEQGNYIVYKSKADYDVDDVVVYRNKNNRYIVHRIIEKLETGFITQGDANQKSDFESEGVIENSQIIGKVTSIHGMFGIGKVIINRPNTLIVVVFGISLILIIIQVVEIVKTIKKKQEEEMRKHL
ncbi:MAG: signal peptidase I [Acholeplasmataceae bacterium]|jgi:signal peptidase|nr:signal peptidase I [Acholeplasmataceae bacterium]